MVIHPNLEWLQDIESNIQDEDWRQEHLDQIIKSLKSYLSHVDYVLAASSILDLCWEGMLGQGRYTELLELYTVAIAIFEGDIPIQPYFASDENSFMSNHERFPNEYFMLKLNLAHVDLLLHNIEEATQHLEHIRQLYPTATLIGQLEACCLFLKYHSYGYEIELDFDLVLRTQQLANKFMDKYRLKGEIAIAYYHYSKGNTAEMEKVLRKTFRLIVKAQLDTSKISVITAELNFYLAVMYRELKQYDQAFAKLDIASEQYARINNHVQNMLVLYETAMIYQNQEQTEKALDWVNQAINEFERLTEKQDYHRAMLDHGKGAILLSLKRYDEALTLFQRVLLVWEKQKHDYHIALATNAIGATIMNLERPTEALLHFEKAKAICDPIKDRNYVKELLKTIDNNIEDAKGRLN